MKQLQIHLFLIILILSLASQPISSMNAQPIPTIRQLRQQFVDAYMDKGLRKRQAEHYVNLISHKLKTFANIFKECPGIQISDADDFVIYDYYVQRICIKTVFFLALPSLKNPFFNDCLRQMAEETFNVAYRKEFSEQVEPPSLKRIKRFILQTLISFVENNTNLFTFPDVPSDPELDSLENSAHEESSPDDQVVTESDANRQMLALLPHPVTDMLGGRSSS